MPPANPYSSAPALVQALALPASAYVGQRIAKSLLTQQIANLPGSSNADKRLAANLLAELYWLAALKPSTCGLATWQTDTHDYLEIAVLHAVLHARLNTPSNTPHRQSSQASHANRLLELIHRTIPYPVVLVVTYADADTDNSAAQISLAHKRLSLGKGSNVVLEQLTTTKIIATCAGNTCATAQFIQYIAFNNPISNPASAHASTPLRDLYARYNDWLSAADALAASDHTGQFTVSPNAKAAASRRSAMQKHAELGQQLARARAQARKASQLAQRAALNGQIINLTAQRQALLGSL